VHDVELGCFKRRESLRDIMTGAKRELGEMIVVDVESSTGAVNDARGSARSGTNIRRTNLDTHTMSQYSSLFKTPEFLGGAGTSTPV